MWGWSRGLCRFPGRKNGACPLVGGTGSQPSLGRTLSRGMSGGAFGLRMSLCSLSADGWDCVPAFFVFDLRYPSTGAYRLLGLARSWCCWPKQYLCFMERSYSWTLPQNSTTNIHVPWENHNHTTLLHETLSQDPQVGPAQVYAVIAFTLGPGTRETFCVPSKSGVFASPSPVELLQSSPTGHWSQMLWRNSPRVRPWG